MNDIRNQARAMSSSGDEEMEMEMLIGMTFEGVDGGSLAHEQFHISQLSCDVSFLSWWDEDEDEILLEDEPAQLQQRDESFNGSAIERIFSQDQATRDVAPPRQPRLEREGMTSKIPPRDTPAFGRSASDPTAGMSLLGALAAGQSSVTSSPPPASLWSLPGSEEAPSLRDILDCALVDEGEDIMRQHPVMRRSSSTDLPPRMAQRRASLKFSGAAQ
mmetsp:Transcript_11033/g.26442  ORF Transcript_11033/g.26442 Transcript_11033/m.26442 type:complete len:217 (-) Transcript_11033:98-748(-)|eukprot:CAMPEP_0168860792 /NCGR_PEP_ID=MMETSP0727-20121128/17573_1 /TAXON_ID=265536 /ORGANISM="Amphiprora sp., Strain CCMP467" /LENGTH=216 /DNA_ID=CAMNT_0008915753 /DNA_START=48 /DNA_END=698 /DNA_ORIENTATION=+